MMIQIRYKSILRKSLIEQQWIYMHPCRNTHTTRIRCDDLLRLLETWDHPATLLDF